MVARFSALLVVMGLAGAASARILPLIWPDSIPPAMPADIRRQVERLYSEDSGECMAAGRALGAMGPRAAIAAPFLATMLNDDMRWGMRGLIMQNALVAIGRESIEPTILVFQFGNNYARMRALDVFGRLKDPRPIPAIISGLADNRGGLGRYAFTALAKIGEPASEYLMRNVNAEDPYIRRGVMLALPSFPTPKVLATLSEALTDDSEGIRAAARSSFQYLLKADRELQPALNGHLRRALLHADAATRSTAIDIVIRTGSAERIQLVAGMVGDSNHGVQLKAIRSIGEAGGEPAAKALAALLAHENPLVRGMVVDALGRMRRRSWLPHLSRMLGDGDSKVREKTVIALGHFGAHLPVATVLQTLADDDPLIRVRAATALGSVRDQRAVAPLSSSLGDEDKGVRLEAARSLSLYYTGRCPSARKDNRQLPANEAVPLYSTRIRNALLAALEDTDIFVREASLSALLERRTPPDIDAAMAALGDNAAELRLRALGFLTRLGSSTAFSLDPVRALLADPDGRVQTGALRVLATRRDRGSLDSFAAAVTSHRDMAMAAVDGLGYLGEPAVPHLVRALQHPESRVRSHAAGVLTRMQSPAANEAVENALKQDDASVRDAILTAIARGPRERRDSHILAAMLRDDPRAFDAARRRELVGMGAEAIESLSILLRDTNTTVRATAAAILGEMADSSALGSLTAAAADTSPAVRASSVEALGRIGGAAAPAILVALHDADATVRETAAGALARVGGDAGVRPLIELLSHPDRQMRSLAARYLGEMQTSAAGPDLTEALEDKYWYVRQAAADALGRIGEIPAVPALIGLLEDPHWLVRSKSHAALKAISHEHLPADRSRWEAWWQRHTQTATPPLAP